MIFNTEQYSDTESEGDTDVIRAESWEDLLGHLAAAGSSDAIASISTPASLGE